ncbi:MAG: hypothetical protein JWQ35_551 [Bacteriovoracaceae bacterium]|nr:hypothetical protein [Bacteriovoracaceae bacterium]
MGLLKNYFLIVVIVTSGYIMSTSSVLAKLAIGGSAGMDFPFAHADKTEPGVSAEGFYRLDPYEVRFRFADIQMKTYSVVVAIKHFFSDDVVRPYIEGALGPVITNIKGRGLGYGAYPEASLGVDIGINTHLSTGVVARYFGLVYFGNTNSGKFEANHGLSLLGNFIVWF